MDISIIIVSFNTKDLLKKCLIKCKKAVSDFIYEIIVVDNNSSDGSYQMVKDEFEDVILIQSGANLGFAGANNLGYKKATGDYILLLNSDAFIQGDGLKKSMDRIKKDSKIGLIGAKLVGEDDEWQPSARSFPGILNDFFGYSGLSDKKPDSKLFGRIDMTFRDQNEEFECDWVPGAYSLIRKEALGETIFDESFFLYYEEVDMCFRLKKNGWRILYYPETKVIHLGGASTADFEKKMVSNIGKQMTLWNYQSKFLFYRKNHNLIITYFSLFIELYWNRLKLVKNRRNKKTEALKAKVEVIIKAWKNTKRGYVSPSRPWSLEA